MPASKKQRYGFEWDDSYDDLAIELEMITRGGGDLGLFEHFMRARTLAWPDRYRHRWTELIYNEIISNIVTILMGPGSSQKTSHASEYILLDYWAHSQNTLALVSTTTVDKLELAVFGEIKMLFNSARHRWPWLAGNPIESKKAISTDAFDYADARDIRKGIIGRACYVGKQYVGLGVFAGIKQQRIRFLADELQFMAPTFLDCLPNMFQSAGLDRNGEPDVKVIGSGNPKHDQHDQLAIAAEPATGWDSKSDVKKTECWDTKFHRGRCVNLIGLDSPNFDVAEGVKPPYPRLLSRPTVKLVSSRWGTNSLQFYSQCVGAMKIGMIGNRVLTDLICQNHRAYDKAVWASDLLTKVGFLDPAWGGQDRCVWGWLEFGPLLEGIDAIRFGGWEEVPIDPDLQERGQKVDPDTQIARFCRDKATGLSISPDNIFYGSTGRGTTGAAFARVFGSSVPVPLAEGDRPTGRPVRHDFYVLQEDGNKRLKRCDEEYGRFNAEMWFSVRNVVECEQMRELDKAVVREFELREYVSSKNGRIELESKDDTRERMGESPDLADALSFGVEGARQRGFIIKRAGWQMIESESGTEDSIDKDSAEYEQAIQDCLIHHGQ